MATRLNRHLYQSLFIQDDWKVTDRLTVNLGLRYDYEGATTESENRNTREFDPTAAISIEAPRMPLMPPPPIPELPTSAFNAQGGLTFASDSNRGFWDADKNNFQPRAGFAYHLNDKTVLRGGWGIYTVPFIISGFSSLGSRRRRRSSRRSTTG